MTPLQKARENAGLSLEAAARLLGAPALRLKRFETGAAKPSRAQLIKLSRIYGAGFAELSGLSRPRGEAQHEGEWYIVPCAGGLAVYRRGGMPKEGEWALVRRAGKLCERIADAGLIESGRVVAARVRIIKPL